MPLYFTLIGRLGLFEKHENSHKTHDINLAKMRTGEEKFRRNIYLFVNPGIDFNTSITQAQGSQ